MANIKGKGQRLIPEELLKYLEALKKEYPEAVDIVEANPTLEGGEDPLSSVLINGVKFVVGGGSTIYEHNIDLDFGTGLGKVNIRIETENSTPFTISTLYQYFINNDIIYDTQNNEYNFISASHYNIGNWGTLVTGISSDISSDDKFRVAGVYIDSTKLASSNNSYAPSTILDTVTEL